jgi:hypothetical protein
MDSQQSAYIRRSTFIAWLIESWPMVSIMGDPPSRHLRAMHIATVLVSDVELTFRSSVPVLHAGTSLQRVPCPAPNGSQR